MHAKEKIKKALDIHKGIMLELNNRALKGEKMPEKILLSKESFEIIKEVHVLFPAKDTEFQERKIVGIPFEVVETIDFKLL